MYYVYCIYIYIHLYIYIGIIPWTLNKNWASPIYPILDKTPPLLIRGSTWRLFQTTRDVSQRDASDSENVDLDIPPTRGPPGADTLEAGTRVPIDSPETRFHH